LTRKYTDLITHGPKVRFVFLDEWTAVHAARLRAETNLALTDAMQVAAAVRSGCDAVLTNDLQVSRAMAIRVILLKGLEP